MFSNDKARLKLVNEICIMIFYVSAFKQRTQLLRQLNSNYHVFKTSNLINFTFCVTMLKSNCKCQLFYFFKLSSDWLKEISYIPVQLF